jgi:hypothetical protein
MSPVLVRRLLPRKLAFNRHDGGCGMLTERKPTRPRRQRDVLVETVYEIARIECRRLAGSPSAEFRKAVDALEAFDAAEAARTGREDCAR